MWRIAIALSAGIALGTATPSQAQRPGNRADVEVKKLQQQIEKIQAEIKAAEERLKEADTPSSRRGHLPSTEAQSDALFDRLDTNKDGQINEGELTGPYGERLAEERDKWDINQDGLISRSEFRVFFAALRSCGGMKTSPRKVLHKARARATKALFGSRPRPATKRIRARRVAGRKFAAAAVDSAADREAASAEDSAAAPAGQADLALVAAESAGSAPG